MEEFDDDILSDLSEEEIVDLTLINLKKMVRVSVELKDQQENKIEVTTMVEELLSFIMKQMEDGDNQFSDQIIPLVTNIMTIALNAILSRKEAGLILTQQRIKQALMIVMGTTFLVTKYLNKNNYKVFTVEEKITREEVAALEQYNRQVQDSIMGSIIKKNPKEVLRRFVAISGMSEQEIVDILKGNRNE